MECTTLRERERERVQKYKINEEKKGSKKKKKKNNNNNNNWKEKRVKSAQKKKKRNRKKGRNKKNRTSEKKESGNFFLDKVRVNFCCTGQCGIFKWDFFFFFSLDLLFKLGRLQFDASGEKTLGPQFSFPFFFSYQIHQNINFSFILFFSIILKIHPTKQTSLEKSSISLY